MKKLVIIFILFLFSFNANATHIAGGEIWYEYISGNTYNVHLRLYRDCGGPGQTANLGNTAPLLVSSSTSPNLNLILNLDSTYEYNSACIPTTCSNLNSVIRGFEIFEYSNQISLPNSAPDWQFSYSNCCRNNAIVNVINPGVESFYIKTTLNNSTTPFNNSVFNPNAIPFLLNTNSVNTLNLSPIDVDGDSIDIHFITPISSNSNSLNFTAPYTFNNPFNSISSPVLNPTSGSLTFTPQWSGTYVFAIEINEYRSGVLIASSIRDYQFIINTSGSNQLPTLTGINATNVFTTSVPVCNSPSTTLSFTVNSADLDIADSTFISAGYIMPGATFTTNNAQNQTGTFTWNVTPADIRAQPYVLNLIVKDNQCITGQQSYGYLIYVNNCNTDSVWAGDANADFTCDNYDVLNIGIAAGSTGTVRPGATTNWQAEYCPNWTGNFVSNINYKHADCNGDGIVNSLDMNAVSANYGLTHLKNGGGHPMKTTGLPDLYFDVSNIQAYKGTTVNIPIMLGNTSSPMNDIYGLATTIEVQNALLSSPVSLTNNTNWIGNISNSLFFQKSIANAKIDFTNVRIDQQNISGQGQIATLVLPIDANSITGSKISLDFKNSKLIKNDESEITQFNILMDSITILDPLSINDISGIENFQLFPNPANNVLNINFLSNENKNYAIKITDITGKICATFNINAVTGKNEEKLNIQQLSNGTYTLEIKNESTVATKMFIKK
ncbi:MAG: T9SS type A sorting domain-containing protein [Chitinophagaceae bacterium]|nr:T9SS type A sorting domain-containing protein [Chitinophagaceae bacterium]